MLPSRSFLAPLAALLLGAASHPAATPADDLPACRRTSPVAGPASLALALAAARPGDCLIAADGDYADLTITAHGTATAPVQLRALHKLGATAGALVVTRSAHVIVQGFTAGTLLIDNSDH